MHDNNSLAHTSWNCKYHIVFAPKYRRKIFYGQNRAEIGKIMRELCDWKGVHIVEAEVCPDHIHMLVEIPPKMSVSGFMGFLKGISKRKEQYNHTPKTWKSKIQIWKQVILVQRILRRHSRKECKKNTRIYKEPTQGRSNKRPNDIPRMG